jgi:hypothetical protein
VQGETCSIHVRVKVKVKKSHYRPVKGKAIPLQALTGLKGSRMLRLPDFKTIGT